MTNAAKLHSFIPVLPRYQGAQSDLIDWLVKLHGDAMRAEGEQEVARYLRVMLRYAVAPSKINRRFYEAERESVYDLTSGRAAGADIYERTSHFGKRALEVLEDIYGLEEPPEHLIHVTCTGYFAPSAPQVYFSDKHHAPDITHAYHMGCYASLPAVRMASSFTIGTYRTVDIVHTEMCSLHADPTLHSPEQIIVQTLFGDGHIKYSVSRDVVGRQLEIECVKERLIPNSQADMTWVPAATCMRMTLSREVPGKIRDNLPAFLEEMALDSGLKLDELVETSLFAIHPGGPRIIEQIAAALDLKAHQTVSSSKVLKERGNMSSATLPHVWKDILDSDYEGRGVSLAFGPGLTMFGALFGAHS